MSPARAAALDILAAVRRGALLDRALDRRASGLDPADRRLAQELSYGVLRLRARLDARLGRRVRGGLARVEPSVQDALRLGLYQLTELDRVPDHAAVDESVEAAREAAGAGAASLVNAVLRRVAREGVEADEFPDPKGDPVGWAATWGSHPRWLVERWLARHGADAMRALVDANNRRPAVALTLLGLDVETARRRLAERGIDARDAPLAVGSLEIETGDLAAALETVPAVVQDPAAALVTQFADPPPGAQVVDLCAAPGGKSLRWAASGRRVFAVDRSRERLRRLEENCARTGLHVPILCADAAHPPFRPADCVVLDAPCTGTGTLRRHPDARWRLEPSDLEALTTLQRALLAGAAGATRPGGLLIYATCSLEPEENEDPVNAFLDAHDEFEREPPSALPRGVRTDRGDLFVFPPDAGTDGAFAARLRRRSRA